MNKSIIALMIVLVNFESKSCDLDNCDQFPTIQQANNIIQSKHKKQRFHKQNKRQSLSTWVEVPPSRIPYYSRLARSEILFSIDPIEIKNRVEQGPVGKQEACRKAITGIQLSGKYASEKPFTHSLPDIQKEVEDRKNSYREWYRDALLYGIDQIKEADLEVSKAESDTIEEYAEQLENKELNVLHDLLKVISIRTIQLRRARDIIRSSAGLQPNKFTANSFNSPEGLIRLMRNKGMFDHQERIAKLDK